MDITSLRYNIAIQFQSSNKTLYEDVQYMAVIRAPIVKQSNVYILKINIEPVLAQQIRNDINDLTEPLIKLMIYAVDKDMKKPAVSIFDRDMQIIDIQSMNPENISDSTSVCVRLTLVNPVIYEMGNRFSFNVIKNSANPKDVLLDYEGYITQTYGDVFSSKHIFNNPNTHLYEQIITMPTDEEILLSDGFKFVYHCDSDLSIPTYLNYKYKLDDVFGFYYFDDFNLMDQEKMITRYFISLYDVNKFEKVQIEKYGDIINRGARVKNTPFADNTHVLIAKNAVYNYRTPDNKYACEKVLTGENTQIQQTSTKKVGVGDKESVRRESTNIRSIVKKSPASASVKDINVYAPDTIEQAKARIRNMTEVFNKKIDDIEEFKFNETGHDWLQFGKGYNFAINAKQSYNYTPISIVNVFNRINAHEVYLSHHCQTSVIKFKLDK